MVVSSCLSRKTIYQFLYLCELVVGAWSHGRLIDPPARGTMWRWGFFTPLNYNDNALYCGGFERQWQKNKGRCGECGDPWDLPRPRPNESGGIFGTGKISKVYREGEEVTVTVHLTANHLGWFEFRLCANDEPKQYAKQSCLNKHVLQLADLSGTRYKIKKGETGLFKMNLKLPEDVTCSNCILQWHYTAGNNWGNCASGQNKPGCGPQEVFRGCSDIAIFSKEDPDYSKYENLTRKFDLNEELLFNENTGHYFAGQNQRDESSEEQHLTIIPTIQTMDEPRGSKIKNRKTTANITDKSSEDNNELENEKIHVNLRWGYNRNANEERKSKIENGYYRQLIDKFRNPNYFREEGDEDENDYKQKSHKYISSTTFRRHLASSSEVEESKQTLLSSRKQRLNSLTSLLNRPRKNRKSSEMYKEALERKRSYFVTPVPFETVRRQLSGSERSARRATKSENTKDSLKYEAKGRENINFSDRDTSNTVAKISGVISMLLNLTASSPSSSEANDLLDDISTALSTILARSKDRRRSASDSSFAANLSQSRSFHRKPSNPKIITSLSPTFNRFNHHSTESLPVSLVISPRRSMISLDDLVSSGIPVLLDGQARPQISPLSFENHSNEESNPVLPLTLKDLISLLNQQQQ